MLKFLFGFLNKPNTPRLIATYQVRYIGDKKAGISKTSLRRGTIYYVEFWSLGNGEYQARVKSRFCAVFITQNKPDFSETFQALREVKYKPEIISKRFV